MSFNTCISVELYFKYLIINTWRLTSAAFPAIDIKYTRWNFHNTAAPCRRLSWTVWLSTSLWMFCHHSRDITHLWGKNIWMLSFLIVPIWNGNHIFDFNAFYVVFHLQVKMNIWLFYYWLLMSDLLYVINVASIDWH